MTDIISNLIKSLYWRVRFYLVHNIKPLFLSRFFNITYVQHESNNILFVFYFDSCCFLKVFFCFRNILKYIFFIFLNLLFIYVYQNNSKIQKKKKNQQKDQNILESGLERKNKPHLN